LGEDYLGAATYLERRDRFKADRGKQLERVGRAAFGKGHESAAASITRARNEAGKNLHGSLSPVANKRERDEPVFAVDIEDPRRSR
jgi:hypothetical protein